MNNKEYFFAYIGPVDSNKFRKKYPNGEGLIRASLQGAFEKVAGHCNEVCGSGWGIKKSQLGHINFASFDEETKVAVIQSYLSEKKKMPDYVEAWYLLLKNNKKAKKKKIDISA